MARVRDEFVSRPPPASTLMIVQGSARPEFKVEIEAVAADPLNARRIGCSRPNSGPR